MSLRGKRVLATVVAASSFAAVLVGLSTPASAACDPMVQRSYRSVSTDWYRYDSFLLGPAPSTPRPALTHSQTYSQTASIGGDIGTGAVVVSEIRALGSDRPQ